MPLLKPRLRVWPTLAVRVNTANGEASLTVMEFTARTRSSSRTAVVFAVPSALKTVPVPSSVIMAVPVAGLPAVGVAVSVKVSRFSNSASCSGVSEVRTSSLPELGRATLPEV